MTFDVVQHNHKVTELLDSETPFATITLLDVRGSAPQITGAKAIVTAAGIAAGTIGGGKIEASAIVHAQDLLSKNTGTSTDLVTWNLQTDIGMTCGGEVKLFFEVHGKVDWPIAVFGAGHIAQTLIPLLAQLNCRINCIDTRSDWLSKLPTHPKIHPICTQTPSQCVAGQPSNTFFVLMSKGHANRSAGSCRNFENSRGTLHRRDWQSSESECVATRTEGTGDLDRENRFI